ncbi:MULTISPECIES: aminotransferase class I/II-fold pyridoxal phosphate-dependent enzyme [Pseudomonas]|jgi:histidinol-phosphate aminotransferase|uniref:aminotransferase class I/II-fold pyridoxal phosphate-dependent enzyme n=1 Tax=Pseudomonas TaxID=286 RepID=UPI001CFAABE9|nr:MULTISPECIES: aminotransferase class I/II-fold pyridoxal phosphate-dependent enzyme [Pseudomonas]
MPLAARQFIDKTLENPFPGIPALERELGRPIISRLSGNEALPIHPDQWLRTYREEFLDQCRQYPDPAAHSLRLALGRHRGIGIDEVLVDAGADSLIHLALRTFTRAGDQVLCSTGTYPTFEYFARAQGLEVRLMPYAGKGMQLRNDLPGLLAAAWDIRPNVLYLANPDNPTGHYHNEQTIQAFAQALPEETLLLLDEAYLEFAVDDLHPVRLWPNTLRLRSFSKAYGLAGLRIGYAMAPVTLLDYLVQARIHYSVCGLSQWLAEQALDDSAYSLQLRAQTLQLRVRFQQLADEAGLTCLPCATNFVTLCMPSPEAANHLQWALLELGVSVSKPATINGQSLIRITLQPDIFVPQIARLIFARPGRSLP